MTAVHITIPDGVDFSDLQLTRDPVTGDIEFDWEPIQAVCEASGLDVALFRDALEDNVSALIAAWYAEHRQLGGMVDPVQEQIIAEVEAEDTLGAARVQPAPGRPQ